MDTTDQTAGMGGRLGKRTGASKEPDDAGGFRHARHIRTSGRHPATAEVNTTGLAVTDDTVTVGILHSITGTMALSEIGSVQAEKLAIDQINASGGVLGSSDRIRSGRRRQ